MREPASRRSPYRSGGHRKHRSARPGDGALGLHSLTAYWDQTYAEPRRRATPVEQHIHSLQHVWSWSIWRHRRRYQARLSHDKQRGYPLTQMPLQDHPEAGFV